MDLIRAKIKMSKYNTKEIPNGALVKFTQTNTKIDKVGIVVAVCQRSWGAVRYKVMSGNGSFIFIWDNRLDELTNKYT